MNYRDIQISDYHYALPEDSIAQYPLAVRDMSRVLVAKGGHCSEICFRDIANHLPADSLLVCNDSRVIPSRLIFRKATGAYIEIFCLQPVSPSPEITMALRSGPGCEWKCMVGNARKWKKEDLSLQTLVDGEMLVLTARKTMSEAGHWTVRFEWNLTLYCWADILEIFGRVPLPPYIKRAPGESDKTCYQTMYAVQEGSVAAPTAGLHFTESVMKSLSEKGILRTNLTLHVGEGTFKPVSSPEISSHMMHKEFITVTQSALENIIGHCGRMISAGTTSLRALESFYWAGVKTMVSGTLQQNVSIGQWEVYESGLPQDIRCEDAFRALLEGMRRKGWQELLGETSLIIVPGYAIRTANTLITNFHLPQSTLLLLVAAFAGPAWKKVYDHALAHDFRFLSYGDACLFHRDY
jgi:S-adenosylmethionine:tRNA ribosyltransferase-isomerase